MFLFIGYIRSSWDERENKRVPRDVGPLDLRNCVNKLLHGLEVDHLVQEFADARHPGVSIPPRVGVSVI
jgi:hypothetical protein